MQLPKPKIVKIVKVAPSKVTICIRLEHEDWGCILYYTDMD